jgi:hypothetical protein
MNDYSKSAGRSSFVGAAWGALQWRLLLLWIVGLLLPTLVVAIPVWRALSFLLDHNVHVGGLAHGLQGMLMTDTIIGLGKDRGGSGAALVGLSLTVLLSPFLTGMAIASGRAGRPLSFGHLLQGGIVEYGRMFRLLLWSLPAYAIVAAVAHVAFHLADDRIEKAVLESQANIASHIALAAAVIVFVVIQLVVEAARAQFIADLGLRSATRAMGRGLRQLFRRPLSTLLTYLVISIVGYAIVFAIAMARIRTTPADLVGLLLALLLVQLGVAVTGWMRTARLFALAEIARGLVTSRRRRSDFAPVL